MDFNRCIFVGNLTRDPEARTTGSGKQVTNFSIAVNNRRGGQDETIYLKVETWGRTAEIAEQYLRKGSEVLVEGRLKIDEYTTREGEKRRDPVIVADNIQLGARSREGGGGGSGSYGGGGGGGGYSRDRAPRDRDEAYSREESGSYSRQRGDAPSGRSQEPDIDADRGESNTEDDLPF